ncbi:MAG TPA: TAXI family TRAP transporter solute-binding subunit [Symbiobacteriaceae bacterium]
MRRISLAATALLLLLGAGCSPTRSGPVSNINVATATTGGAYYPIGNAIANIWSEQIPGVRASAQSTNGTPHNLQLLAKGDAEVAFAESGVVYEAVTGTGAFAGQPPQTHFAALTYIYPNVMQWLIRPDSGIASLADLKGKRVVPGPQNSATELNSRNMLSLVGLNYRERADLKADFLDYNQAAEQLKNRQADAILLGGAVPIAAVMDVMTSGEARMLSLPEEYIRELTAKFPWYFPYTIPAGTYRNQDEDVQTVAVANILIVRKDLPEDLVYDLVRTLYENQEALMEAHSAMRDFRLEDGLKGITGVVDLHPGAERYFREKGLLD